MAQKQVNKLIWNLSWGFGMNELLYALDPSNPPYKENNNRPQKKKGAGGATNLSQGESTGRLQPLMRDE